MRQNDISGRENAFLSIFAAFGDSNPINEAFKSGFSLRVGIVVN